MVRVTILLLLVAIAYTAAFPQQNEAARECGPNEEFVTCGSPCVSTCDKPASPVCVMKCEIGCQCKSGYVRNRENQCVLTRDC